MHVLSGARVSEVMTEVPAVSPDDTLDAVQEIMFAREIFALPEDNELAGIISMSDVTKIDRSERANVRVAAVYTQSAFPDQTGHEVVERIREPHMANFPRGIAARGKQAARHGHQDRHHSRLPPTWRWKGGPATKKVLTP
jgi:CBS domain-containing protein